MQNYIKFQQVIHKPTNKYIKFINKMLQQVLNYEHDIMQKQTMTLSDSTRVSSERNTHRYGIWKLQDVIDRHTQKWVEYKVKWIGEENYSHALALFYCVLHGCLIDESNSNSNEYQQNIGKQMFLRFKYSLYQESKQVLNVMEQKSFIQHLGLIQDSKNIGEFLKKSTQLESILIKLFANRCSQMTRKHLKTNSSIKHSKMQQLQWYSAFFPFCTFGVLEDKCSNLTINRNNFLIVQQKDCFFVIQEVSDNKFESCRISDISTRKKIKTEVYGHGFDYIQSLKTFDMIENKNQTLHDDKIKRQSMIKSQSKQFLKHFHIQEKATKIQSGKDIIKYVQNHEEQRLQSKHSFFNKNKKGEGLQKQKVQKAQDLRDSIRDNKIWISFGSPKMSSVKASLSKQKSKNTSKKQNNRMIYSIPNEIPEIFQRQIQNNGQPRQDFIYQSLNPQQIPAFKKQLTPKHQPNTRVPKFLTKKNQQTIPYTFSNSPVKDSTTPIKTLNKKNDKIAKYSLTHNNLAMPTITSTPTSKIDHHHQFHPSSRARQ